LRRVENEVAEASLHELPEEVGRERLYKFNIGGRNA
jgi:hypothetical protein